MQRSRVIPSKGPQSIYPEGYVTAVKIFRIGCATDLTSPDTKKKWYHTYKHVLMPCQVENMTAVCLSSKIGKKEVSASPCKGGEAPYSSQ